MKTDEALKSEYAAAVKKKRLRGIAAETTEKGMEAAQPEKVQLQLEQAGKAVKEIQRDIDCLNEGIREFANGTTNTRSDGTGRKGRGLVREAGWGAGRIATCGEGGASNQTAF